jgi:hypothetical protein
MDAQAALAPAHDQVKREEGPLREGVPFPKSVSPLP